MDKSITVNITKESKIIDFSNEKIGIIKLTEYFSDDIKYINNDNIEHLEITCDYFPFMKIDNILNYKQIFKKLECVSIHGSINPIVYSKFLLSNKDTLKNLCIIGFTTFGTDNHKKFLSLLNLEKLEIRFTVFHRKNKEWFYFKDLLKEVNTKHLNIKFGIYSDYGANDFYVGENDCDILENDFYLKYSDNFIRTCKGTEKIINIFLKSITENKNIRYLNIIGSIGKEWINDETIEEIKSSEIISLYIQNECIFTKLNH